MSETYSQRLVECSFFHIDDATSVGDILIMNRDPISIMVRTLGKITKRQVTVLDVYTVIMNRIDQHLMIKDGIGLWMK